MGTYATFTSLQVRMPGVDFSISGAATLAAEAITDAEQEVNKYLSKRYDLSSSTFQTSTSIPPMVRMMTNRLAEGYLWQWLSRGGKESMKRGEALVEGVIKNLTAISEYKMDLLDTAGSAIPASSNDPFRVQCSTTDYTETFAEDGDLSQAVDSEKLDDISDARD